MLKWRQRLKPGQIVHAEPNGASGVVEELPADDLPANGAAPTKRLRGGRSSGPNSPLREPVAPNPDSGSGRKPVVDPAGHSLDPQTGRPSTNPAGTFEGGARTGVSIAEREQRRAVAERHARQPGSAPDRREAGAASGRRPRGGVCVAWQLPACAGGLGGRNVDSPQRGCSRCNAATFSRIAAASGASVQDPRCPPWTLGLGDLVWNPGAEAFWDIRPKKSSVRAWSRSLAYDLEAGKPAADLAAARGRSKSACAASRRCDWSPTVG